MPNKTDVYNRWHFSINYNALMTQELRNIWSIRKKRFIRKKFSNLTVVILRMTISEIRACLTAIRNILAITADDARPRTRNIMQRHILVKFASNLVSLSVGVSRSRNMDLLGAADSL